MKKTILLAVLALASSVAQARSYPFTTFDCTTELNTKIKVEYFFDKGNDGLPKTGVVSINGNRLSGREHSEKPITSDHFEMKIHDYQDAGLFLSFSKDKSTYQRAHGLEKPMNCKVTAPVATPEDAI
jgi:hypothetical protein